MPLLRPRLSSLLLLLALLGVAAPALAAPPVRQDAPQQPQQRRNDGPHRHDDGLSDSVRRIERSTRGQVLSAERVPYDGRSVNRIKIVDERGRVRVYMDDPQSREPRRQPRQAEPPTRGDDG